MTMGLYLAFSFVIRSKDGHARIGDDRIVLPYNSAGREKALKHWMRSQTRRFLQRRLQAYTRQFRLSLNGFSVQDTKKWGHCTKDRRLVFNEQLIALPRDLADYVVLHEITHLGEFNHSAKFRHKLASICPDFREKEAMLKRFLLN
jgi:hypothetical protein